MKMSWHSGGRRVLIATGSLILLLFLFCSSFAAANDINRTEAARLRQDRGHRQKIRRMIRRDEQKKVQESSRKDFSRDKSRLDYKVEASANKLPDSRIRDQKYLSAETQRGREEAKLEEEKLRRPDEELAEAASMAQEVLMRQGKRDFFGIELR